MDRFGLNPPNEQTAPNEIRKFVAPFMAFLQAHGYMAEIRIEPSRRGAEEKSGLL